jgi:predicted glycosyltransferase
VPRYLFSSHDVFGLGHTRRNSLIARALLAADPEATVTLVTGLAIAHPWLSHPRLRTIRVPSLVKDEAGTYRNSRMTMRDALARRAAVFTELVT